MIQFLPLAAIAYIGYLSAAAFTKTKNKRLPTTNHFTRSEENNKIVVPQANTIHIVRETIVEDDSLVLSKEDIPLDNRFGKNPLVSENRFSRSADITMELERTRDLSGSLGADIFSLLEAKVQTKMANSLGLKIGSSISREIKLKFIASAGQFAHYRVVWKQDTRRGFYDVEMAGKRYTVPFMVTYGLCHSVVSVKENGNESDLLQLNMEEMDSLKQD